MLTVGIDTYITLADARAYASLHGLALPKADADLEKLLKRATVLLDRKFGALYLGYKATTAQGLAWPRMVYLAANGYGRELPTVSTDSDGNPRDFHNIPRELSEAVVELAALLNAKVDMYAQTAGEVTSTKVVIGKIEIDESLEDGRAEDLWFKIKVIVRPVLKAQTMTMTRGA